MTPRTQETKPVELLREARDGLKAAKGHIEHMARWIAAQKAGYSFGALGEDSWQWDEYVTDRIDDYLFQEAEAVESDVMEAMPVARAHVRLEDDGLFADLEVLNGERMQPEHSPVDLYLAPPQDKPVELLREIIPHMQWFLDKIRAARPEELRQTHWMSAYSMRKANDLFALLARIKAHLSQGESA